MVLSAAAHDVVVIANNLIERVLCSAESTHLRRMQMCRFRGAFSLQRYDFFCCRTNFFHRTIARFPAAFFARKKSNANSRQSRQRTPDSGGNALCRNHIRKVTKPTDFVWQLCCDRYTLLFYHKPFLQKCHVICYKARTLIRTIQPRREQSRLSD